MESRDIEWARRCVAEYAQKPTNARALNSAQCLPGILALLDETRRQLDELVTTMGNFVHARVPAEPCHDERDGLTCYLATGHAGDHSTNVLHRVPATWPQEPPKLCAGFPAPADGLACFRPDGHTGPHSNDPEALRTAALATLATRMNIPEEIKNDPDAYQWRRAGHDPCPARSWDQKTCTKGYLHTGGHEWGTTQAIVAGPDLPDEQPTPLELEAAHYRDTTRTITTTQPWGACPNTPPCKHPAAAHDIESFDDPRPMCCEEGCVCRPSAATTPPTGVSG